MEGIRALTLAALIGATSLGLQGCGAEDMLAGNGGDGSSGGDIVTLSPQSPSGADDSVTVSWIAPSLRQDGSGLKMTEIAGYLVHYGPSSGNYTNTVEITDNYDWNAVLTGLTVGEPIYVVVEAVDTDGLASGYSEEVSLLVN